MNQQALLLFALALGTSAFSSIGLSGEKAISGRAEAAASAQTLPRLTSRQSAALSSAGRFGSEFARVASELASAGSATAKVDLELGSVSSRLPRAIRAQLTSELFGDIAATGERFVDKYPTKDHWFVGLGRSPHVLLGYVEAKNADAVVDYMPLSNGAKYVAARSQGKLADSVADHSAAIAAHFAKHLPTREALGERTLTLVDFSFSGKTIKLAREQLDLVARERGIPRTQLQVVALKAPPGFMRLPVSNTMGVDTFVVFAPGSEWAGKQVGEHLFYGMARAEEWVQQTAPVGQYDVLTLQTTPGVAANRYEGLVDWMRLQLTQTDAVSATVH